MKYEYTKEQIDALIDLAYAEGYLHGDDHGFTVGLGIAAAVIVETGCVFYALWSKQKQEESK